MLSANNSEIIRIGWVCEGQVKTVSTEEQCDKIWNVHHHSEKKTKLHFHKTETMQQQVGLSLHSDFRAQGSPLAVWESKGESLPRGLNHAEAFMRL